MRRRTARHAVTSPAGRATSTRRGCCWTKARRSIGRRGDGLTPLAIAKQQGHGSENEDPSSRSSRSIRKTIGAAPMTSRNNIVPKPTHRLLGHKDTFVTRGRAI